MQKHVGGETNAIHIFMCMAIVEIGTTGACHKKHKREMTKKNKTNGNAETYIYGGGETNAIHMFLWVWPDWCNWCFHMHVTKSYAEK